MTSLVTVIGVCAGLLVAVLILEHMPATAAGRAARMINETLKTPEEIPGGVRGAVARLEKPVARWYPRCGFRGSPQWLLARMHGDLYWAQMAGEWRSWTAAQLLTLRIMAGVVGGIAGLIVFQSFLLGAVAAFIAWEAPGMLVSRIARRQRRRFQAEFPEYVQLLAAQAAGGISLEESLLRTSTSGGIVAAWVGRVVRASQGRSLYRQLEREARQAQLPELLSFAMQLEYVSRGLSQQDLLGKLATSIANEYLSQAETRAERVGAELVIPMVLFYFLPFVVTVLAIVGWPILASMGGQ